MADQAGVNGPSDTVQRYVEAFNAGDEDGLAECFVENGSILDGMAPYVYSGPSATREWHRHAVALAEHPCITDFHMILGTPTHEDIVADAAYFVAPATLSFKIKGQPITQSGATFTVALQRIDGRWLIALWAWAKGAGGGTG
jgi:hypothetical protein